MITSDEWTPSAVAARRRIRPRQSISQHGSQDGDHLTIAIVGPGEFASHPLQRGRQHQSLNGAAVAQCARLRARTGTNATGRRSSRLGAVAAAVFRDEASSWRMTIRSARHGSRQAVRPHWRSPSICCCRSRTRQVFDN